MIANRYAARIAAALMMVLVILCLCAMAFSAQMTAAAGGAGVAMEYESRLFDTSQVLDINIVMDDADWQAMLDNALAEEYVECDVEVAGQTFCQVGIRPKGNTSLSAVYNDPDTSRYSFKLEFDHYVEGQTCFGLDKLILNNNYADATSMKEALVYDLYAALGADASLYNYAKVSVNGEYWGLYLALEGVEDSFMLRNYGAENGRLYKPENMGQGGGSGSDLNYTDDDPDHYSAIWEGEVTDASSSDHKRVIAALKNISQGIALEQSMDTDNLLRYAAVHIFSVNDDSLSGSMAHNYYLYESNGRLNLLPWDYNLAFGGMGAMGGDATDAVNSPIDDAWNSTDFFDALLADETYHDAYEACLEEVTDYVLNGGFEAFYTRTRSLIDSLVETDPTAFYSCDEYQAALETFCEVVKRRAESVRGQLAGTIPSTRQEQQGSDALIDASDLDLTVMGTMEMGGGRNPGGEFGFNAAEFNRGAFSQLSEVAGEAPAAENGAALPEDAPPSETGEFPTEDGAVLPENAFPPETGEIPARGQGGQGQQPPDLETMPERGNAFGPGTGMNQTESLSGTLAVSYGLTAAVVLAAFLLALFYRRKPRKR